MRCRSITPEPTRLNSCCEPATTAAPPMSPPHSGNGVISPGATIWKRPGWLRRVYLLAAVWVGFVLFGAPGLAAALAQLRGILTWQAGDAGLTFASFFGPREIVLLLAAAALCGPVQALCPRLKAWLRGEREVGALGTAVLLGLLFLSITLVTAGNYQGFIYAQF